MNEQIRGFVERAKIIIGLETPTPAQFAVNVLKTSREITELLKHLNKNFPNEEHTKLGDINPKWANIGSNPLGGLAEMGHPDADKIINPKSHIFREITLLKNKIEVFRKKMKNDQNSKKIVGVWDNFWLDRNPGELRLSQLPETLKNLSDKLNISA